MLSISFIIEIALYVLCIYGCYYFAKKGRHNTVIAIILGILFSVIALIIYFLLSLGKK